MQTLMQEKLCAWCAGNSFSLTSLSMPLMEEVPTTSLMLVPASVSHFSNALMDALAALTCTAAVSEREDEELLCHHAPHAGDDAA